MTTTALANAALALLGEQAITSIDDGTSASARACKQFIPAALGETLRLGRWNCATRRAGLDRLTAIPASEVMGNAFQLPTDCLRVMEVNGEDFSDSSEFYEIEGDRLISADETVTLRYVSAADISKLDPLLQNAVALRLAHKISIPLTGSAEKSAFMLNLFGKALSEARQVDAQESGSREKNGIARIFGRSRLLNQRRKTRNPLRMEDF